MDHSHPVETCITRVSLLGRIRDDPHDQVAWREFVDLYGPRVYQWCTRRGLSHDDAQDVTQNVLVKLSRHLKDFRYDRSGSFRGWLHTVTTNVFNDYLRSLYRRADAAEGGSVVVSKLESVGAKEELQSVLAELFDFELMREAMRRVRKRVKPERWLAFELTALRGLNGAAAASEIGIPVATIYSSKSQIIQKLKREADFLLQESN
ncbi:MAG: sigma-70 family RNA polymerase sigma factor [Planctomycetota bacterium]